MTLPASTARCDGYNTHAKVIDTRHSPAHINPRNFSPMSTIHVSKNQIQPDSSTTADRIRLGIITPDKVGASGFAALCAISLPPEDAHAFCDPCPHTRRALAQFIAKA